MGAAADIHPTDLVLQSYGLGKLDDEAAEVISQHLDVCPDCVQRITGMSSDSFLGRLRRARLSDSGLASGISRAGATRIDGGASSSAPPPAATLPAELANNLDYEIIRELEGGGMGRVYLAHNRLMGRHEVIKLIDAEIIERPGVRERFLREIRAVAKLRHPNIVTAYSAFRAGASLVFAMEYVEGFDLARRVTAKGPMPVRHASYFVHQAALGLQHAHEAGMVHRDIKPGNLMLSQKGGKAVIKVLDFGLAKAEREQKLLDLIVPESDRRLKDGSDLTLAGQFLGTPDFVAPEQITDAQGADILADIYSLGCTLYYLLSGRPPFQAQTLHDVLQAHRSTDARLLNFVRPEVPTDLAALTAKMMAKDPHRRFQTPGEVAQALVPFFTPRTTATVSPNLVVDPNIAQDAGSSLSESTAPDHDSATVCTPATQDGPRMWSSLIEFKNTEQEADATGAVVTPARARSRRFWPVVVAFVGFAAVIVGVAAVTLPLHHDRGKSVRSAPVLNVAVLAPAAKKTVHPPVPNHSALTPSIGARAPSGPNETPKFENPKSNGSPEANGNLADVPTHTPSVVPRPEADRRQRAKYVKAKPDQDDLRFEESPVERLKRLPHVMNKSMRWENSVYVLDAEDDVRRAAAEVTPRYNEYRRACNKSVTEADRKDLAQILKQQLADLSHEQRLLRATDKELRRRTSRNVLSVASMNLGIRWAWRALRARFPALLSRR